METASKTALKVSDLRLGNYLSFINYEGENQKGKVISLFNDGSIWVEGCESRNDAEDLKPIPLTPEILEKAGFKKGNPYSRTEGWTAPKSVFFFEDEYNPKEISSGRHITFYTIEHLHQLQNLYFALTGEELQIEL